VSNVWRTCALAVKTLFKDADGVTHVACKQTVSRIRVTLCEAGGYTYPDDELKKVSGRPRDAKCMACTVRLGRRGDA
jgi:hypothetical protein